LIVAVAAVVVVIVLIAAGGDEDYKVPKGSVANVNGKTIPQPVFDHWFGVVTAVQQPPNAKKKTPPPKKGSQQYKQTSQQVMQFLVTARWIEGEAADRDITATPQEVARQFKETRKQSFPTEKAYEKFLKQSGQVQEDIDYRVKLDVLSNKIRQEITSGASDVSNGDIENYYKQNEAQFSQPERRDVQIVLTKAKGKADQALSRLKSGESFKKVAKQLSEDPATKNQGGQLLGITKGQQETDFDAALFQASKGSLEGPVKTSQGYYVFKVSRITPATKQSLEQSKEGIRQLLISQKQQQSLDKWTTGFRTKWRKRTNCVKELAIPDCKNGQEPPPAGLGTGPAAKAGSGTAPALGGVQLPSSTGGFSGAPGAQQSAQAATAPAALSGNGQPYALIGESALGGTQGQIPGGGIPQGGVPQGGAPQGGAPQGGAPQGGAPQGGAPQGGAPQQVPQQGGAQQP
jgi:foldase protein PrsA